VTTARILLIDDDVDLLDMLRTYLEREEFAVTATDVAATGVAAALSTDHDLAVLDVMMPLMSGIEDGWLRFLGQISWRCKWICRRC